MPKRDLPWRSIAGTSKVSRNANYSPRAGSGPRIIRPRMDRVAYVQEAQDLPDNENARRARGCEGPCKVQSFEQRHDVSHVGKVICISDVTRGNGITHRVGKRFCVKSVYILGKIWMDENIKLKNHTNSVMFWLVRDRRPYGTPMDFGQVFNMFDNEPSTATVKNDLRDRYQVMHKFYGKVTGGQYASNEQAIVKRFWKVNNHVVYNHQEAGKYENHTENALLLYMACTHASNPVYATLKIRIYFYDSIMN
uniref:Capsid protein n=1 Tax=Okra yellow mosaic Mexico virus TaxID=327280 RepID=E5KCK9_9GEMI|nr:coat protein [Okra yellow mosaic Mexico virus]ADR72670.1 coat protein [Okra yellow mosaic Mexico virus]